MEISVTDFSAPIGASVFKFCVHFSVTDFSAPYGASVFKFCVHLQIGKMYCVNENLDAYPHLPSFFNFSFFPSVTLV